MHDIAKAVQEGAAAYLNRQFRTLAVFSVIVFLLLLVLPVTHGGWARASAARCSSSSAPSSPRRSATSA